VLAVTLLASLAVPAAAAVASPASPTPLGQVVPAPVSVHANTAARFDLTPTSVISYQLGDSSTRQVAQWLAGQLRPSTGYPLPVVPAVPFVSLPGISLAVGGADSSWGSEGYRLDVDNGGVHIKANSANGVYDGVQTLLQLLPAKVAAKTAQRGPWPVAGGEITDYPRYGYRGALLDVARHFFTVPEVERYLDQISRYKINYLQLHLTDSQGWRIQIDGWPRLTSVGGSSGVSAGGVRAGYYTQADYQQIVRYAAARYITVIPEIEGPAHSNAALASYAELNCDGVAAPLFQGVGPSPHENLCLSKDITYTFMDTVIRQMAALTPGPYLSIGGDEAAAFAPADYATYIHRVQAIVAKYGKKLWGWQESAAAADPAGTLFGVWIPDPDDNGLKSAPAHGGKLVMSPAYTAYMDMQYAENVPGVGVGNNWAGYVEVQDSYNWDPDTIQDGVSGAGVAGVNATLFTEYVDSPAEIDSMVFPRLPAIAELGWSPASTHDWNSFRTRLAAQGPRWDAAGVHFYRSPQISWP
jgi:hexosaminidase